MTVTDLMRVTALATLIVSSASSAATAQTTGVDPHHPNTTLAQAAPGQAPSVQPAQPRTTPAEPGMVQPAQPGTTPAELGMVRPGMMGHGMMAGMPMMGPRGHMIRHDGWN